MTTTTTTSYNIELTSENIEGLIREVSAEFPSFKDVIVSPGIGAYLTNGDVIPAHTFVKFLTALGLTTGIGLMGVRDVVEDLKTNADITNERIARMALVLLQMATTLADGAGEIARLEERLAKLEEMHADA